MIWRYDWPFQSGEHVFKVRAYHGQGHLQVTQSEPTFLSGVMGIDSKQASILPLLP